MPFMDAKGKVRPGVFETVYDPVTDTTFTPVSGVGNRMTFRATGPRVKGTEHVVSRADWSSPDDLRAAAQAQGVLSGPTFAVLSPFVPGKFKLK